MLKLDEGKLIKENRDYVINLPIGGNKNLKRKKKITRIRCCCWFLITNYSVVSAVVLYFLLIFKIKNCKLKTTNYNFFRYQATIHSGIIMDDLEKREYLSIKISD